MDTSIRVGSFCRFRGICHGFSFCFCRCFSYSVCELDLVFSLHKSLLILFEMFIGGMLCENNKREVLKAIVEAEELVEEMTKPGEDTASQLDDGLSFHEQFQLGRTPGRRTGQAGAAGRR
jgi:Clathrin adaptor complex small chain